MDNKGEPVKPAGNHSLASSELLSEVLQTKTCTDETRFLASSYRRVKSKVIHSTSGTQLASNLVRAACMHFIKCTVYFNSPFAQHMSGKCRCFYFLCTLIA
jgi:hypothetical protein